MALFLFFSSVFSGLISFWAIFWALPYLEKKESLAQKREALKEAEHQRKNILKDADEKAQERIQEMKEELDSFIAQRKEELEIEQEEIAEQEPQGAAEDERVSQLEASLKKKEALIKKQIETAKKNKAETIHLSKKIAEGLESHLQEDSQSMHDSFLRNFVDERQIESQKNLKSINEELNASSRKLAHRILDRVHARYSPQFIWPKSLNTIEVKDKRLVDEMLNDNCIWLNNLREKSGVNISVIVGNDDKVQPHIKVAGGFGIARESARLSLEDVIAKNKGDRKKCIDFYQKNFRKLEAEAVVLGRKAVQELRLEGVHAEIQKLVGALNWRTSYRQNQWHHTVEVAILAGLFAHELGVDPQEAKRVGMLHDIGKALDYRIEGSHAVISGDYADRYGENRIICDTVMSHHADLLVETPLAYVLRAADTLSGARPGARVNLEVGYQIRLGAIYDVVHSFDGIIDAAVMNGGREVHVLISHEKVLQENMQDLTKKITEKIQDEVAYPGQIKVIVSRIYESVSVAG